MVLILSITSLALAAVSAVSGLVIPRKSPPPGWDYNALESYDKYHHNYLEFDCEAHHGQPYFDQCCHPRLANETNVPFPAQCGCDGDDTSSTPPSSYTTPLTPTPTYVPPTSSVSPDSEPPSEPSSSTSSTPESSPTPSPSPVSDSSTNDNNSNSNDNSSNDNSGSVNTGGQATFFYQDGNPGACGQVHSDSDLICAMDQDRYGDSGNASPLCGKQVQITNTDNGKTVTVTVADDCPTCANSNSIDLSVAAFQAIADLSTGDVPISWSFA